MLSTRPSSSTLNDFHSSTPFSLPLYQPTPSATTTTTNNIIDFESAIYQSALAQLQQHANISHLHSRGSDSNRPPRPSAVSVPPPHAPLPPHPTSGPSSRHDSGISDGSVASHDCMHATQYNSMGGVTHRNATDNERARSHHPRTPSTSTIASNQPASPYVYIANPDRSPASPAFYVDQTLFPENDIQFHYSSQGAPISSAHLAMKNFGFNHHIADSDLTQADFAPSRQSMSSYGNDSPATPRSGAGDIEAKSYGIAQNEYHHNPNVQLFRTESQAFQDELFDPHAGHISMPTKPGNGLLSPHAHRNLLGERLQTANLARSTSPASGVSRDRSPFRDGSPLAPPRDWKPQGGAVGTAAGMRQQQKDEAAQAEYAQHRAALRREPTKTISPKDALLEYHENDQAPLFHDSIPAGYEKHMGGTEQWPSNNYLSQAGASFGALASGPQPNMSFRNATADQGYAGATLDFSGGLPQGTEQIQSYPFQTNYQAAKMNNYSEATPDFPATIPSMETSISDAGIPPSSQESCTNRPTSTPQRPDDTRANTGTYTCTYHGCTQRFDSHANLQKHKRDLHRSQQQMRDGASTPGTASSSPRSSESPAPPSSGMTSAAILARNSQAGPHKCTRINPSTNKPCNTIFSRPYDLTRHEDTIHNNRKQKVRCPMCREEKTFSRNDALTRHMRVVHPEVENFGKRGRRGD